MAVSNHAVKNTENFTRSSLRTYMTISVMLIRNRFHIILEMRVNALSPERSKITSCKDNTMWKIFCVAPVLLAGYRKSSISEPPYEIITTQRYGMF